MPVQQWTYCCLAQIVHSFDVFMAPAQHFPHCKSTLNIYLNHIALLFALPLVHAFLFSN